MGNLMDVVKVMPKMLSGKELLSAMTILPTYDDSIRNENEAVRLMALSDLYNIYLPSPMSMEIYSKLYLSLLRSLQKKNTTLAIQQRYENNRAIQQQTYNGIIGGSDSYAIIGCSGIGKSSAISRAISLISEKRIIETDRPYSKIIPCLNVQCPFDCSVKGLLLEILRKSDEELGTNYYQYAVVCISREIYGDEENTLGYVIFYRTKNDSEFAYFESNTYLGNGYNSGITDKIQEDSPFLDKNGTDFKNMLSLHEMITALEFIDNNNLDKTTCEEFYEVEEGVVYIKLIEIEKWIENK